MATKPEKILFFEYVNGIMIIAYQISKTAKYIEDIIPSVLNTLEKKENVKKLLDDFAPDNNFSRTKSFGLLYRFLTKINNTFGMNFHFSVQHGIHNVDDELFAHYAVPKMRDYDYFDFYFGQIGLIKSKRDEYAQMLANPESAQNSKALLEAKALLIQWFETFKNVEGLHHHDSHFKPNQHKRDYGHLIWEAH